MNEANNKPSDSPLAGESDQRPEQKPQAARQDKIPFDHGNIIIPVFPISILDYYALQEFERILRRTKQDGPDWDVEKEKIPGKCWSMTAEIRSMEENRDSAIRVYNDFLGKPHQDKGAIESSKNRIKELDKPLAEKKKEAAKFYREVCENLFIQINPQPSIISCAKSMFTMIYLPGNSTPHISPLPQGNLVAQFRNASQQHLRAEFMQQLSLNQQMQAQMRASNAGSIITPGG